MKIEDRLRAEAKNVRLMHSLGLPMSIKITDPEAKARDLERIADRITGFTNLKILFAFQAGLLLGYGISFIGDGFNWLVGG